ncbi:MAG: hypothetical protein V2A77_07825 [Pseudomonadota bacterium]
MYAGGIPKTIKGRIDGPRWRRQKAAGDPGSNYNDYNDYNDKTKGPPWRRFNAAEALLVTTAWVPAQSPPAWLCPSAPEM